MRANVVRNACGLIERMSDETIESKEKILVEDMQDGTKYALVHLQKNERILIFEADDEVMTDARSVLKFVSKEANCQLNEMEKE